MKSSTNFFRPIKLGQVNVWTCNYWSCHSSLFL